MMILRKHVERIVRPLRAATSRKHRMREELLAHLTDLHDDEMASRNDETAAIAAALARFGDPDALRADLQASIPTIERILSAPVPLLSRGERRPGESVRDHTRRVAPTIVAIAAACSVSNAIVVGLTRRHGSGGGNMSWFYALSAAEIVIIPALAFGTWLLCDAMRGSARARIAALVAHAALYAVSALVIAFMADCAIALDLPAVATWGFTLFAAAGSVPIAIRQAADHRRFDAWRGLDLDVA